MPTFMARYPKLTRGVFRRAAAISVPSDYLQRGLAEHGFQTQIIPNVIRAGSYPFKQRRQLEPRFLWMRTFHPIYNPEMAIRTFAKVRQTRPNATLVMAGQEKGSGEAVRALTKELGLENAIEFPGFLDMQAKAREFARADVFLNTNDIDNTPVSVIEACAAGVPVVATNVGGLADLLTHEQTGLLVPPNDDQAMANAISQLLDGPDLAESLSANARQLALACSWENVLPQWECLFEACCKGWKG